MQCLVLTGSGGTKHYYYENERELIGTVHTYKMYLCMTLKYFATFTLMRILWRMWLPRT